MSTAKVWLGYGVCLLIGGWPLLSVLGAGLLHKLLGCTEPLTEASKIDCVRWGIDFGEIMYTMAMMSWFLMFTLGMGVLGAIAWTVIWMSR